MACSGCERRRKKLLAMMKKRKANRNKPQADSSGPPKADKK